MIGPINFDGRVNSLFGENIVGKMQSYFIGAMVAAVGVIGALWAIKVLGVDNDVPGFKQAAEALDQ